MEIKKIEKDKGENHFKKYSRYHGISDYYDLTIAEIILLEFLSKYDKPVVRHALYTEVNQFVQYHRNDDSFDKYERIKNCQKKFYEHIKKEKKSISTSTFYSSLINLEQMGLLSFEKNLKGKVNAVKPTPFTRYLPKLILKFIVNNSILDTQGVRSSTIEKIVETIGDTEIKNILTVWFTEYIVYSAVQMIASFSDEVFILAKILDMSEIEKMSVKNVRPSKVMNGLIREPNNFFDGVLIPVYKREPKFHNIPRENILKEIVRVTKSKGYIGLIAMADVSFTKNVYANELINIYRMAVGNRIFTDEQIKEDLINAGIPKVTTVIHEGLIIAYGKKP